VSVRPFVRPIYRPLQQRAAGLLLWARRAGDIDRSLQQATAPCSAQRSAANASSVTLSAVAES